MDIYPFKHWLSTRFSPYYYSELAFLWQGIYLLINPFEYNYIQIIIYKKYIEYISFSTILNYKDMNKNH